MPSSRTSRRSYRTLAAGLDLARLPVRGRHQLAELASLEVTAVEAEHLRRGGVGLDNRPGRREQDDSGAALVEDRAVATLALAQRFVELVTVVDVLDQRQQLARRPRSSRISVIASLAQTVVPSGRR